MPTNRRRQIESAVEQAAAAALNDDEHQADGSQTSGDGTPYRRPCARRSCPKFVYKPETGRPGRYCSESCRQMDYRDRRRSRQELDAHNARIKQLEDSVRFSLELCNVKPPKRRDELAEVIIRSLMLNGLIE